MGKRRRGQRLLESLRRRVHLRLIENLAVSYLDRFFQRCVNGAVQFDVYRGILCSGPLDRPFNPALFAPTFHLYGRGDFRGNDLRPVEMDVRILPFEGLLGFGIERVPPYPHAGRCPEPIKNPRPAAVAARVDQIQMLVAALVARKADERHNTTFVSAAVARLSSPHAWPVLLPRAGQGAWQAGTPYVEDCCRRATWPLALALDARG